MNKYEIIYYKEPRDVTTHSPIFKDLRDLEDYINDKQATVLFVEDIMDCNRYHIQYEVEDG